MHSNVYEDVRFLKFLDSLKTQKFKNLENKNLFLLQIKESIHDTWIQEAIIWQKMVF